jgi:NTP pyrophosphatase (non-canonical NTP hydrolase)
MHLAELQDLMDRTYGDRDRARGCAAGVAWLAEEVGELAQALRKGSVADQRNEFADVLAWVATLANLAGVDLDAALDRYSHGCPKCAGVPCTC